MTFADVIGFLNRDNLSPIIDVRSPAEFLQGHIPGAHNIPLFTDDERARVGTCYKKQGHDPAVQLGLSIVGPKVHLLADELRALAGDAKSLRVLCFRGGMRSSSMIGLASLLGIRCMQLKGGYKAFRRYCAHLFTQQRNWKVIGGYTGSGKSELLRLLKMRKSHVLDLEMLANHRGSTFGAFQNSFCPTTEQFENMIAFELKDIPQDAPIFVEDESRMVGSCVIPHTLFQALIQSKLYFLTCSLDERIARILEEYGSITKDTFVQLLNNLYKRLGREKVSFITKCVDEGSLDIAVSTLLEYYDARYDHALQKQKRCVSVVDKEELLNDASRNP